MKFPKINYRAHNNYDQEEASNETAVTIEGPSMTIQSMTEDADLNVMMKRFGVTGKFPENVRIPTFGDFSQIRDYRSALEAIGEAHDNFMTLPAELRAKFDNDPQLFLDFCTRPENRPAMRDMGLLKTEPEPSNAATGPVAGGNPPAKPSEGGPATKAGTT